MIKKLILASLVIIIFIIIAIGINFLATQTHFLNLNPSQDSINQNNTNPTPTNIDISRVTNLIAKNLIVPEQFKSAALNTTRILNLPENFEISVYSGGFKTPRAIELDNDSNLYFTDRDAGKVYLIKDDNNDNVGETVIEIDNGLRSPHGIELYKNDLYVAEETQIVVYRSISSQGKYSKKDVLGNNLPDGVRFPAGGHTTRTIKVGPDEKLYVSIGSSCNICEESDKRRAAIVRYNLDGSGEEIFAEGLRNTVDFDFFLNHTTNKYEIYGVDNGRDRIGDDIPPEEINIIEEGKHYGWPFCYGNQLANPEYSDRIDYCKNNTQIPYLNLQAHSAPLSITRIESNLNLYNGLLNDTFLIGFHGSWNRTTPTGYKVVAVNKNIEPNTFNFITGWMDSKGEIWGRPVDIQINSKGEMFITDDKAGCIYKVVFK